MDTLVTTALVGTAQRDGGDDTLGMGAPFDALLAELGAVERERRLLLLAGARAVYRLAGAVPKSGLSAPQPAPAETLPACSAGAAELMRGLLSGTHPELLSEALERLRRAGLRLPFDLLPLALSAKEKDQRAALAPVLGERGRWLSQLNPAWAWARGALTGGAGEPPEDAETIWQEGVADERIAILRQVRAHDPARAREWLAGVWKREKADMRAELIQTLDVSLGADDEAFLEAALDDRSAAVRDRAAYLLARLPESALAQRLIARADSVLSYDGATLKVQPVKTFEKAAARDGLIEKPPQGTGQRAWWVMQFLCRVPPAHWRERFGVSPDVLVAAAANSEWMWPVIEGWTRAFLLHGDDTWLLALWRVWSESPRKGTERQRDRHDEVCAALAPHVPREELERLALRLLDETHSEFSMTAGEVLGILPRPWSVDFSVAYLSGLRAFVSSLTAKTTDFAPWDDALVEAAALGLPAECFAAALEPFPPPPKGTFSWRGWQFYRKLVNFTDVAGARQRLWEEIPL